MSQLEVIAGQLRALAQSTGPISANVQAAAGRLRSIASRLESIKRSGVDTRALEGAILSAEAHAQKAADAVRQVQSEGTQWAGQLASGGGGGTSSGGGGIRGGGGGKDSGSGGGEGGLEHGHNAAKISLRNLFGRNHSGDQSVTGSLMTESHPEIFEKVVDSIAGATESLARWNGEDQALVERWFGGDLDTARKELKDRLGAVTAALRQVRFASMEAGEYGPKDVAYVYPERQDYVLYVLDNCFYDYFGNAGSAPPDSQVGIVLHELSHFPACGGTFDYKYGPGNCAELARTSPKHALENADNFEFYMEEF